MKPTLEQLKQKASSFRGHMASFRLDAEDGNSRVRGRILEAEYSGVHKGTGLHTFSCKIQGASGRIVTIDAVENYLTVHRHGT